MNDWKLYGSDLSGKLASWPEHLRIFLVSLTALAVVTWKLQPPTSDPTRDSGIYDLMAKDPFAPHLAPWGFRVLTPLIVHLLHLGNKLGFDVVTVCALALTATLMQDYLRHFVTPKKALVGTAMFVGSSFAVFAAANPWLVDPLGGLTIIAALYAARRDKWIWLLPILPLSFAARESAFALIVFALGPIVVVDRSAGWKARGTSLGVGIALTVALIVILQSTLFFRTLAPQSHKAFSLHDMVQRQLQNSALGFGIRGIIALFVLSWGALWIAFVIGWKRSHMWVKLTGVMLLPIAGSVLVATDGVRMLSYMFPVLIAVACSLEWTLFTGVIAAGTLAAADVVYLTLHRSTFSSLLQLGLLVLGIFLVFLSRSRSQRRASGDGGRPGYAGGFHEYMNRLQDMLGRFSGGRLSRYET
jgi:hypothetical protein